MHVHAPDLSTPVPILAHFFRESLPDSPRRLLISVIE